MCPLGQWASVSLAIYGLGRVLFEDLEETLGISNRYDQSSVVHTSRPGFYSFWQHSFSRNVFLRVDLLGIVGNTKFGWHAVRPTVPRICRIARYNTFFMICPTSGIALDGSQSLYYLHRSESLLSMLRKPCFRVVE